MRLVLDDLSKPQLRLSRYKSGTDGGYSEQYYQLDENQIAKIKTAGLNAYIVHCGEDSTAYKLYVENGTSGAVKEYGTITAFSGTYQYKYQQRVVNGTHVTVEGFEYPDLRITVLPRQNCSGRISTPLTVTQTMTELPISETLLQPKRRYRKFRSISLISVPPILTATAGLTHRILRL